MRLVHLFLLAGLAGVCLPSGSALAQTAVVTEPHASSGIDAAITDAAQRFALPAAWLQAIIRAESGGKLRAVSPKGAMGLMQIMPATWRDLRVRHRLGTDPFDLRDNIIAGAGYIRELLDRYGSPGWIAAYNAGPGRYETALRGRPLPAETRAYVAAVVAALGLSDNGSPAAVVPTDRFAWTRSPLFIARADSPPSPAPIASDPPLMRSSPVDDRRTESAASGLFVGPTSRDDRP